MPMSASDRRRLERNYRENVGPQPIRRETMKYVKQRMRTIIDAGLADIWSGLDDDERDAMRKLGDRLQKVLQ